MSLEVTAPGQDPREATDIAFVVASQQGTSLDVVLRRLGLQDGATGAVRAV